MPATTTDARPPFGALLRAWRNAQGKSQLAVSLEAGVSARHLSFLETGRATPSREMVLALAEALDVPLRERNALLDAAGYAAVFRETPLDAPRMAEVRAALMHILAAHAPNPALVVNRRYDILLANEPATRLIALFAREYRGPANVTELLLSSEGLRRWVSNWREVTAHVALRVRAELSAGARDAADEAALKRVIEAEAELREARGSSTLPPAILVPMKLRRDGVLLDLFTTITTLGTPLDITLQDLRIETLFPMDGRSRAALDEIVSALPPA